MSNFAKELKQDMITKENILETLLKGERVTLECKLAQSNVPNDVWRSYSAFANTYGGLILLGVNEDLKEKNLSKRFTITGVKDASKIRKDFWNVGRIRGTGTFIH